MNVAEAVTARFGKTKVDLYSHFRCQRKFMTGKMVCCFVYLLKNSRLSDDIKPNMVVAIDAKACDFLPADNLACQYAQGSGL